MEAYWKFDCTLLKNYILSNQIIALLDNRPDLELLSVASTLKLCLWSLEKVNCIVILYYNLNKSNAMLENHYKYVFTLLKGKRGSTVACKILWEQICSHCFTRSTWIHLCLYAFICEHEYGDIMI